MYSIKNGRRRKKTIFTVLFVLFVCAIVGTAWYVQKTYKENLKPVSTEQRIIVATIEPGSSVHDVAVLLEQKGLIRKSWAFEWYVRSKNVREDLQAGSFAFSPSMSVQEIVAVITDGKVATDLFTILPAKRIDQLQDSFNESFTKSGFSKEQIAAALQADNYSNHPALTDKPKNASLEGYLYPESFQKTANTSPAIIVKASLDEMAEALSPEVRAGIIKQGLTIHQGVTLASIIENEVSRESGDRTKVAQVFLKRLKMGMKLQSDPTAFYGAEIAGQPKSLAYDSPYNTYQIAALPPGPISNVSSTSLQAVAEPANTDFLYFVAGDDGTTHFSKTLSEHEALTKQYCTQLCQ